MHELSVAQSIIEIVRQYVPAEEEQRVRSIQLRIGTMAGIVTDSLRFCFEALTAGSPLARAQLAIESVPFTIRCRDCGTTGTNDDGTALCTMCSSGNTEILSGTEMRVAAIAVDEPKDEEP